MSIVSSIAIIGHQQVDGRRYVREQHTDNVALIHELEYLAPASQTDIERDAVLALHAAQTDERLKREEVELCVEFDRLTTVYITKSDLADRVRALFREADRERLARIARWIRRRIQAGDFTEDQVRTAFGLTQAQWDALKVKLQAADDALAVIEGAKGE